MDGCLKHEVGWWITTKKAKSDIISPRLKCRLPSSSMRTIRAGAQNVVHNSTVRGVGGGVGGVCWECEHTGGFSPAIRSSCPQNGWISEYLNWKRWVERPFWHLISFWSYFTSTFSNSSWLFFYWKHLKLFMKQFGPVCCRKCGKEGPLDWRQTQFEL